MQPLESSIVALANRVAKLEAQNRRLKKLGIASLVVVAAVITMGQVTVKKVIRANEFEMLDSSGNVRAHLSVMDGSPSLDLFDEAGQPRVVIANFSDGPQIALTNPAGKVNLQLRSSGLTLFDPAESERASLSTSEGKPSLVLNDSDGFSAIFGRAALVRPSTGRKESTSAASIVLFGKDSKVLWSAP